MRAGLQLARAVRHHELCLYPERFEYLLDSRQTNARPASPSCGIDKDDRRIFGKNTGGIGAVSHPFSLMLWLRKQCCLGNRPRASTNYKFRFDDDFFGGGLLLGS